MDFVLRAPVFATVGSEEATPKSFMMAISQSAIREHNTEEVGKDWFTLVQAPLLVELELVCNATDQLVKLILEHSKET